MWGEATSLQDARLAVYTTVYPGVEPFLAEWYRSLRAQRDGGFDLWIGSDGLTPDDVAALVGEQPSAHWVIGGPDDTPGTIRGRAIARMVERYPAVVFVDSDDLLEPDRVAAARRALETYDLAACGLRLVDAAGVDLGVTVAPPDGDAAALLARHNVIGLSNSAFRSPLLRACLPIPDDSVLVDWLLATRAWAIGASIGFEPTPHMRYRQHGGNGARLLPPFDPAYVARATARVLQHYGHVLDGVEQLPARHRRELEAARSGAQAFASAIAASPARLTRYVDALNALPPQPVWWWCVAHPQLEEVWRA